MEFNRNIIIYEQTFIIRVYQICHILHICAIQMFSNFIKLTATVRCFFALIVNYFVFLLLDIPDTKFHDPKCCSATRISLEQTNAEEECLTEKGSHSRTKLE